MRFRVIDTGIRDGRRNIAFDQALIEARKDGAIPDTIRFLRFRPAALVGIHQILSHEVRLAYCRERGIQVGRRITGGGGLYLDEGQIGWELLFTRQSLGIADLETLTRRICEAAALGLNKLGIAARYRPRNDIEVEGRKISGTGGFFDGDVLFYQGTLLIDFDPGDMIAALKVPVEKLAKRDLESARQRVVTMRELLGDGLPDLAEIYRGLLDGFAEGLGIEPVWGSIGEDEERRAARLHDEEIGTDEFVYSLDAPDSGAAIVSANITTRGGTLRADIRLEGADGGRIREALITGDFFVTPPRVVFDLEAALRGLPVTEAGPAVEAFFARTEADLLALTPADFRAVVDMALRQLTIRAGGARLRGHLIGPDPAAAPTLVFLHDGLGCARLWRDIPPRLVRATGCGALVYDRRGAGDSEPLSGPPAPDYLRDEALNVLPEVLAAAAVREAILVGHSDGGTIALIYAGAYPDRVRGVITEAAHLFREERTLRAIREQIEDFERGDLKARLARYHGGKAAASFERLAEIWLAAGERRWGIEDYLARIRCPVLALQGEDDEYFSALQLDAIAAAVPSRVETLSIPDCGHVPHHQARKSVLAAMTRFVEELNAGAASV